MQQKIFILGLFLIYSLTPCFVNGTESFRSVLVSVAPHKFFVENIAGNTVTVNLMVPAGASAHTFEPTPKQVIAATKADIWFRLGEAFEAKAAQAILSHNPQMQFIDLRKNVDMITVDPHSGVHCCHADSQDLHIWLSCRQAIIQAETIAAALTLRYPEHTVFYKESLDKFSNALRSLDNQIINILTPLKNRTILVSHPAYEYFCRDYHLKQLSIEIEGKDPSPKQLHAILLEARAANIRKVFVQPQYSSKGAKLFAHELKGQVVILDPYSEDYINTMSEIAKKIAQDS